MYIGQCPYGRVALPNAKVRFSSLVELYYHHGKTRRQDYREPKSCQYRTAKTFTFLWFLCLQSHFDLSYPSTLHDTNQKNLDWKMYGNANGIFCKTSQGGSEPKKLSYSCSLCNYTCEKASNLKSHILVHSGEKPFVCAECNFSSAQKSNLKSHMLIHFGERAFSCNQCTRSFTRFFYSQDTHAQSFRRKTFHLLTM